MEVSLLFMGLAVILSSMSPVSGKIYLVQTKDKASDLDFMKNVPPTTTWKPKWTKRTTTTTRTTITTTTTTRTTNTTTTTTTTTSKVTWKTKGKPRTTATKKVYQPKSLADYDYDGDVAWISFPKDSPLRG